ncbi:TPA: hypothetical protein ACPUE9_002973 [Proteus mirabilis]|nr:hypothetical protein [Proteus mirabilis]MBG2992560.1 hypothetical protein [Proteus mirabilis]MBG6042543.1 hypothetical protein [Proteus mirabilis]MBS3856651.1 hypothetical protein [Proteus mirabilis]MCI9765634.1 hypothetical protein [Proteus mirabilis]MCI9769221.1 hypothetical protein [Proteus mirabilis]
MCDIAQKTRFIGTGERMATIKNTNANHIAINYDKLVWQVETFNVLEQSLQISNRW